MRALTVALALTVMWPATSALAQPVPAATAAARFAVDAIDPTPQTNPLGAPYPGARGPDQLVVYTRPGQTGTNEYGFEVTIHGGRVVLREGANSNVPADGFVVSGHGRAATWIRQSLPLGTAVDWQPGDADMTAIQDPAASLWRARLALAQLVEVAGRPQPALQARLEGLWNQLPARPQQAATAAEALLQEIRRLTWRAYPTLPEGARAVWYRPEEKDAAAVEATVARAKGLGVTTLYVEALYHGYPIYPSAVYQRWGIDSQYPRYRGWDPLKAYFDAGRKHGVTIVPWVHTIYAGYEGFKPPSPILAAYPQWTNRQRATAKVNQPVVSTVEGGSFFLDPANPEVVRFFSEVMSELAQTYEPVAIQLDDTRYPLQFPKDHPDFLASTWGYTPVARREFQTRFGLDPLTLTPDQPMWDTWTEYRMGRLTELIAAVRRAIKAARPDTQVQLDFSTNPQESYERALQDWTTWADRGLVDAFAVLNYTSSLDAISQNVRLVHWATLGQIPIIGGVFGPFLLATPDETLAQMLAAKRAGADVISLFSLQKLTGGYPEVLTESLFRPIKPADH